MKELLRRLRGDASAGIALLLAAAGGLACVLVLQAHAAARTHRHAAEQTLRDYARFAGWQLGRQVEDGVLDSLNATVSRVLFYHGYDFRHLRRPDGTPDVAAARGLFARTMTEETAWCGCPDALHTLFAYSVRTGEIATARSPALPDAEGWLRREMVPRTGRALAYIRAEARPVRLSDGSRATLPARPSDAIWVDDVEIGGRAMKLAYTPILGDEGGLGGAEVVFGGFLYDPAKVARPVMEMLLSYKPLLPPTLTGGAPNERTLAIVATSLGGDTIFRTPGALPAGPLVAVDTLVHDYVSLVTHVAVRSQVADALVIGGLPRSRLPLLAVTLALTLGLGVVAFLQLRRQAELVRLRGDFVSGVSHELRTPLAQIQLFADLLAAPWLPERERANSVRVIGEEARRLGYLVGNVLRFSGAERGATTVRPLRQEIAPLLESAAEAFAPLARASGTVVRFAGAPAATVPVDGDALRQVLLNLLDNASKYAPGTEVRLGAEVGGDGWMRIRVDDGGPGIPAAERERVWEPFHRLDRDARSATGGSGIGLSIVRTLVEGHGGRVAVGDAPGGGARFTVELPGAEGMEITSERIEPAREVA